MNCSRICYCEFCLSFLLFGLHLEGALEGLIYLLWKWTMKNTAKLQKGPWPLEAVITGILRSPPNSTPSLDAPQ